MQFFYRNQSVDDRALSDQETLGLEAALILDITDFYQNPSKGSCWRIFAARDWTTLSDSAPWTIMGGELSKYFDFGASASVRQRTLALNFWTVDSPTWESSHTDRNETVYHRPPS